MLHLLLSLALASPISPQEDEHSALLVREQFEVYSNGESSQEERDAAKAQIAALMPGCLASMFEVFVKRAFDAPARPLQPSELQLLRQSLAAPDAGALFSFLRQRMGKNEPLAVRLSAFDLVDAHGRGREVPFCVELVLDADSLESRARRSLVRAFGDSLEGLVQRDAAGIDRFSGLWGVIPDAGMVSSLRALGKSKSPLAVEALVSALHHEPRAAGSALAELGRLATSLNNEERREAVQDILFMEVHGTSGVRAALTRACLALQSPLAIPTLVELLADEDQSVVDGAHRALVSLTGVRLRPEARRWREWLKAEEQWFDGRAQELLEQLHSAKDIEVQNALRELALHSYFRERLSADFIALLDHSSSNVRTQACHVLAACHMDSALPRLVQTLRHDEESVWPAAWAALKQLSGEDLPPEPELWEALLAASDQSGS